MDNYRYPWRVQLIEMEEGVLEMFAHGTDIV